MDSADTKLKDGEKQRVHRALGQPWQAFRAHPDHGRAGARPHDGVIAVSPGRLDEATRIASMIHRLRGHGPAKEQAMAQDGAA